MSVHVCGTVRSLFQVSNKDDFICNECIYEMWNSSQIFFMCLLISDMFFLWKGKTRIEGMVRRDYSLNIQGHPFVMLTVHLGYNQNPQYAWLEAGTKAAQVSAWYTVYLSGLGRGYSVLQKRVTGQLDRACFYFEESVTYLAQIAWWVRQALGDGHIFSDS